MISGLQHSDRFKKELIDERFFLVEERSLSDFMNFSIKFSKLLTFFNEENVLEGDASILLENNIEVLIIQISSLDTDAIDEYFEAHISGIEEDREQIRMVFKGFFDLLETIESWNKKSEGEEEFNKEVDRTIESRFARLLVQLLAFESELNRLGVYDSDIRVVEYASKREWLTEPFEYPEDYFQAENETELLSKVKAEFSLINHALTDSLALLVTSTAKYVDIYLNDGVTQPHIALFIAFIEMYQEASHEINKFTERHLQHFYKEILKLDQKEEIPDKVDLIFDLQDGEQHFRLPEGTELAADVDAEGNDVVFTLDQELVVTRASVADRKIIVNDADSRETVSDVFEPIYLHENVNQSLYAETSEADYDLGIAFASSFLKLKEGDRQLNMVLEFQRQSFEKFVEVYESTVHMTEKYNVLSMDEFMEDLFGFSYSSLDEEDPERQDWFTLPEKNITTKIEKNKDGAAINRLHISAFIDALFPALDGCIDQSFPEAVDLKIPVCKLFLNPKKLLYYNFYKELIVEKIHLDVTVEGVKDLIVQNDFGEIDSSVPFEPFGATPAMGSTFYLGHETIFSQKLNNLEFQLEWYDLPLTANGFPEHYEGYAFVDSNEVFKVDFSFLKDRKWYPKENKQVFNLFRDGEVDEETGDIDVDEVNLIDTIDLKNFNFHFSGAPILNGSEIYDRSAKNGFIKLEFSNPVTAFGHKEYPLLVNKVAASRGNTPMPNTPWTPTLKSISVNFSSSITVDIQNQEKGGKTYVYHVHPFGVKKVSEPVGQHIYLMPQYDEGSEILLAVDQFDAYEPLSIYVRIDEFFSNSENSATEVKWSYLSNENWVDISYEQILQDSTNDLANSGIIIFDFPSLDKDYFNEAAFNENQSYPPGFFWLKCTSNEGTTLGTRILMISAQAGTATYQNRGNSEDRLGVPLPKNTVAGFVEDMPSIREVMQPYDSYGGRRKETPMNFKIRVSERLRHKNRAVNRWDYEHLVLENFPNIQKVICLTNIGLDLGFKPGSILILVIPKVGEQEKDKGIVEPRANQETLSQVKNMLLSRTSPFASLEVRNPIYEQVQVKFDVGFKPGLNQRYYLQKVNEDLKNFLNPWGDKTNIIPEEVVIDLGSRIHSMHIIYFLEKISYIDFVANLSVFHLVDGLVINLDSASDYSAQLEPQTQISIFVSAEDHIVNLVGSDEKDEALGAMMIGKDFTALNLAERQIRSGVAFDQVGINANITDEGEEQEEEARQKKIKFKGFFK